jgi:hypothetical protein
MPNNIINASSSGSGGLITTAADSGSLELQSDGTTIATLSSTGLTMAAGKLLAPTGPAFSAYKSGSNQSITSGTYTKVTFNTENFDTNNNFASSTFTPTVAGYYQINGRVDAETSGSITRLLIAIWKNGSEATRGNDLLAGNSVVVNDVIYCNGTTDYLEIYTYMLGTSLVARASSFNNTYFSGSMVRSA